ncbi:hypothetical protein BZL30_6418 [Mycobacterium kansasii]|uniref:Uncharacterized protein n=1 Tax=Mycobacterium kansasii TaxID=1768 RepID=A0A1V3WT62_MYCKA|nr:hypothetical protein BZL30_6418 [Mycobacterium kansasii]
MLSETNVTTRHQTAIGLTSAGLLSLHLSHWSPASGSRT